MALEHAILVSLAERSASGYDLARRFDASIGQFWKASHQQIYKTLSRMESAGQVSVEVVAQDGRPDKKVYAITRAGHAELAGWLATPTAPEVYRSELAVKLRALHLADRDVVVADVRARREHHRERLAYYEASRERYYPDAEHLAPEDRGGYIVLRGGVLIEEAGLAWCDEILAQLEAER